MDKRLSQPRNRCRRCCQHIYFLIVKFLHRSLLGADSSCSELFSERIGVKMRKTRLVILPTKCLHQMGFLLLFLSCPVIGDWGRIRPESENSHRAIQIEREGTCGLQRDPPGKLLNFLYENGSDQCQLSEDFDSNEIPNKPIFREMKRYDERRVDLQRVTRERNVRETERREVSDARKEVRKALQRVADERRNVRMELPGVRRDTREILQIRTRSVETRQSSKGGQQANERATRRQTLISARRISKSNEMEARNDRERLHQMRRMTERQNERRTDQQRRSVREVTNERREDERTVRSAQEKREGETRRLVRSAERERVTIRRDDNRRSLHERSLRKSDSDVMMRQIRERNLDGRNVRLSLTRKEENYDRRSENERNPLSPIRRTRDTRNKEVDGIGQRVIRNFDNRRDVEKRQLAGGDIRDRRVPPLSGRTDRIMEIASARISGETKHQNLPHLVSRENKNAEEKLFGGITKWVDLKRFGSLKAGDWTTNCIVGAAIYFFSMRQIKAV